MRILVTNDDGVESPGIKALAVALAADGHDVTVFAPTTDRSGAGAAIGKIYGETPPPVVRADWPDLPGIPVHALDAPPATAVLAACLGAFGATPELVASGINPGQNTGHLVLHSGTVGAALTAAGLDVPALAVSLQYSPEGEYLWETAAAFAAAAVEWVAKPDDGTPRVLNINVPNVPVDEVKGVREAALAAHGEVWIVSASVAGGDLKLEFKGQGEAAPGTDVAMIRDGYVAVTPLLSVARATLRDVRSASEAIEAERAWGATAAGTDVGYVARMTAVGDTAPDFTLKDQNGNDVTLSSFRGQPVVIVFYPFTFTGVCQGELCEIRDDPSVFERTGAQVLAISCDTRHAQRVWAEQQGFTFPVLSDFWPHGEVSKAYGVFNEALGCANRATFVLDKNGVVSSTFSSPDLGTPRAKAEYDSALATVE